MFETCYTIRTPDGAQLGRLERFIASARDTAQRHAADRGQTVTVQGERDRRRLLTVRPDGTYNRHY